MKRVIQVLEIIQVVLYPKSRHAITKRFLEVGLSFNIEVQSYFLKEEFLEILEMGIGKLGKPMWYMQAKVIVSIFWNTFGESVIGRGV
jgi:hypothetical protein